MNARTTLCGASALLIVAALAMSAFAGDDPDTIANRAYELRLAGQVDEAVAMLETALGEHPDAGILHYELARARMYLLDIAGMQAEAEAAVRCAPDNNEFRYFAAMASGYSLIDAAHHGGHDRMKALGRQTLDELTAILEADPEDGRARVLLVQQMVEMAPELGLEVDDPEAQVEILEGQDPIMGARARCCLVDQGQQKKIWKKILATFPGNERVLVEAADGLITAGDLELAGKCLDQATREDMENGYVLLRLGLAYAMQEDWKRAAELTERFLAFEPPPALEAFATGRMGMIRLRSGDPNGGRALMARASEMDAHVWETVMPPPKEIFTPLP